MKSYTEMVEITNMINYVRDQESKMYYNPDPKYYNTFYNSWVNKFSVSIQNMAYGCTEMERQYSELEEYITKRANKQTKEVEKIKN